MTSRDDNPPGWMPAGGAEVIADAVAGLHREALQERTASDGVSLRSELVAVMKRGYSMHGDGLLANMADAVIAAGWQRPEAVAAALVEERWKVQAAVAKEVHALAAWLARERDDLPGAAAASALANAWEGRR
jgi:hypothetical protein